MGSRPVMLKEQKPGPGAQMEASLRCQQHLPMKRERGRILGTRPTQKRHSQQEKAGLIFIDCRAALNVTIATSRQS